MIKDVSSAIFPAAGAGSISLYWNSGCSNFTGLEALASSNDTVNQSLGAGYVLPAKASLYAYGFFEDGAVTVNGYLIPNSAVSAAQRVAYPNKDVLHLLGPRAQHQWYRQHGQK